MGRDDPMLTHEELTDRAHQRERNAMYRLERARRRSAMAARHADEASTLESRDRHRREAMFHERAADIHDQALHLQEEHLAHLERQHRSATAAPDAHS